MDQNYANASAGNSARVSPIQKPLERIAHAADRVMQANMTIAEFLDRFHGPSPSQALNGPDQGTAIRVSYSNETERLFANLDSLEARICTLCDIG